MKIFRKGIALTLMFGMGFILNANIENVSATEQTTYSSWYTAGAAAVEGTDYEINDDEYIINTALGLAWLSLSIDSDNNYEDDTIVLANDIDLLTAGVENYGPNCTEECNNWITIGKLNNTFNGYFNGDGNTISGIYIDTDESYIGLFGYVANAHIENIGIIESYIEGSRYVGGIVGYAENTIINNVFNKAEVRADSRSGGIVGAADNVSITDVYSIADVMNSEEYAGAIAGELKASTISNTYSVGFVESEAYIDMVVGNFYNMDPALLNTSYYYLTDSLPQTANNYSVEMDYEFMTGLDAANYMAALNTEEWIFVPNSIDGEKYTPILSDVPEFLFVSIDDGVSDIYSIMVDETGKISKPEDPMLDGYIFDGWFDDNGNDVDFDEVVTFTAQYTAVYVDDSIQANPETSDNLIVFLTIGLASLFGVITCGSLMNKKEILR